MSVSIQRLPKRAAALLVVLLVVVIAAAGTVTHAQSDTPVAEQAEPFAAIYNMVSPSVVAIAVEKPVTGVQVFGQSPQSGQIQRGLGSGFVLDTTGNILTNDHVVDGATSLEVAFSDGTLARAEIVGTDPESDIAVIRVREVAPEKLIPVSFANADSLYVGETVLAIGSPFGERWTLTSGIISGLDRVIKGLTDFSIGGIIQTDAAINPGNSGGPLLNLNGEVVGVNAQIASESGSNAGVGFAIPGDLAQHVATQLIEQGYVEYSYLGLSGADVSLDAIEALKLPNDTRGVLINEVMSGGPAARAGLEAAVVNRQDATLQSADIITAINGQALHSMADLISYLAQETRPGDTVTLSVLRNGTDLTSLDVLLIPRPHQAVQG